MNTSKHELEGSPECLMAGSPKILKNNSVWILQTAKNMNVGVNSVTADSREMNNSCRGIFEGVG